MKRIVSIVMAVAMLVICSPAQSGDVEDCQNAETLLKTNPSKAVSACRRLAEEAEAFAQNMLGLMYADGTGVPQDYKEAMKWFRKAADQGYDLAQLNLGIMYYFGEGVRQDYKEAIRWWQLAADQGLVRAQTNLGNVYYFGTAAPQDYAMAFKWYHKAADGGYAEAQRRLGEMYAQGQGVLQSEKEAVKWWRLAADQGDGDAETSLGFMYIYGKGVPQDDKEAVKWWRLAAEQGNAGGQINLGLMYEEGRAVTKDLVQAYMLFDLASRAFPPGANRDEAAKSRNDVAVKMTPDQIAKAKTMAAEWKPKPAAPAQAAWRCKTIILDRNNKIAVLEDDTPVWRIINAGPASVAIQTKGDPAFQQQIAPDPNAVLNFFGDARYTYTIGLVEPGKKATLQVCQ